MIYTRKGDDGETSLVCGKRVSKDCPRVECYGTVDELNSYIGLLRSCINEKYYQDELIDIQKDLFIIQSLLATEDQEIAKKLPQLDSCKVSIVEKSIDAMTKQYPPIKSFIVPGGSGSVASSHAHVARCICRRAERMIVKFSKENFVSPEIKHYLNRLSDYLFTLSNMILFIEGKENILFKF